MIPISDWPKSERPREKLLQFGAKYLSDAELLAIFLNTGIKGKNALDLSRELLIQIGGLKKLSQLSPVCFYQISGLGKAKFALIKAALELAQRCHDDTIQSAEILNNTQRTKRFLAKQLSHYSREVFACIFLDIHHRVLFYEELFYGTLTESCVYPREVVKQALMHNAAKIIFAHNHPSGNPYPSQADCDLTKQLQDALSLVDIQVIDHIVVGLTQQTSLMELGLL